MAVKSVVCVNTKIPTGQDSLSYDSDGSLRDYDIIMFDPTLPHQGRIEFTGGGSCISIEGNAQLRRSMSHWSRELSDGLAAGKTVFILLSPYKDDHAATGSSMKS